MLVSLWSSSGQSGRMNATGGKLKFSILNRRRRNRNEITKPPDFFSCSPKKKGRRNRPLAAAHYGRIKTSADPRHYRRNQKKKPVANEKLRLLVSFFATERRRLMVTHTRFMMITIFSI
uniref:(northern house mosquito) hypothetical protein n=1 Tax=Culex pipiens TaxID=7175 RepID=A0A8D8FKQ6_CULPI